MLRTHKMTSSLLAGCCLHSYSFCCRCWLSVTSGLIWTFIGPALTVVLVGLTFSVFFSVNFKKKAQHISVQSRTQSPQAFWSAGRRQERLWDNGISYPRKRGIPVLVRMLKIKTEVKCPKMAAVLLSLGLKVLSGLESVREGQN